MLNMTRARVIQIWFGVVAVVVVGAIAFGAAVTLGSAAMLLALCVVPLATILMLWPGADRPTIAEVLHDAERRR